MTRKKNNVTPLGYHGNSNQSSPKSDEKHAKLGKGFWNKIATFFSQFICKEPRVVEAFHSQGKVVSMYGELSDSDHQTSPSSPPVKPKQHQQPEFKEVFTLPDEQTNPREAKLTVPITALPKLTECNHTKEQRTNAEILQDLSANGLVGDVQPSMIVESVKPGGVSFEIRMTTVRPRTAKGQRVPRPPRRLESLEVESRMEEIFAKQESKQEKATLQRQVLQETRQQLRHEKSQKMKQTVDAIAAASEKKTEIAEKMEEERAEAVRQEQQEERLSHQDIMKKRRELARKSSKQLSVGFPNDLSEMPPDDLGLDKISTYNGSDESDDDNTDYLKSVKGEDKYDDFYDGPKAETFLF